MGRGDPTHAEWGRLEPRLPAPGQRGGRWNDHRRVIRAFCSGPERAYRGGILRSVSAAGSPFTSGTGAGRRTARGTGFCVLSRRKPTSQAGSTGAWSASLRRPAVLVSTQQGQHERRKQGRPADRLRQRDLRTPQRGRANDQPARELPGRRPSPRQEGLCRPRHHSRRRDPGRSPRAIAVNAAPGRSTIRLPAGTRTRSPVCGLRARRAGVWTAWSLPNRSRRRRRRPGRARPECPAPLPGLRRQPTPYRQSR